MFGWEFPPFQAGGLASATLGLVKGLLSQGLEVTLVVPFPVERSALPNLRLVSAADVPVTLKVHRIPSPLAPYAGEAEYQVLSEQSRQSAQGPGSPYGRNLFEEVERYAAAAAEIAKLEPHDLIDTHDWITFAAGIRAREVSGRPLVAHIHATEFDRVGDPGNLEIVRREIEGLQAADRVSWQGGGCGACFRRSWPSDTGGATQLPGGYLMGRHRAGHQRLAGQPDAAGGARAGVPHLAPGGRRRRRRQAGRVA